MDERDTEAHKANLEKALLPQGHVAQSQARRIGITGAFLLVLSKSGVGKGYTRREQRLCSAGAKINNYVGVFRSKQRQEERPKSLRTPSCEI